VVRVEPGEEIDQLARRVIGAAIEVHRTLGPGYLESVYEEALCVELREQGIPFARQPVVQLAYKGHPVGEARLDLLIDRRLVIELKAVETVLPVHTAQVVSYLKALDLPLGLLLNFNVPRLRDGIKRVILT
jgi:GxxExxY protein